MLRELDRALVAAVGLTAAKVPAAAVGEAIQAALAGLAAQTSTLAELPSDRAYRRRGRVRERPADRALYGKAWPVPNGAHGPKTAVVLDWAQGPLRCPNGVLLPVAPGETVPFPAATWAGCPRRERCTSSAQGRRVAIHPAARR